MALKLSCPERFKGDLKASSAACQPQDRLMSHSESPSISRLASVWDGYITSIHYHLRTTANYTRHRLKTGMAMESIHSNSPTTYKKYGKEDMDDGRERL